MDKRDDYIYLPIRDARKAFGQKVNLFAAVSEIGAPRRSKGTDYVLSLKIVDQSYQAPGLSVNFFAELSSKLPRVTSSGDIICLHHVMIGLHNEEVYCTYKKRVSSFALFKGKSGEELTSYQASANFHASPQDDLYIKSLRECVLNQELGNATHASKLMELNVGLICDLVCKVLHVCGSSESGWMLFVWDGTDVPPVSFPRVDADKNKDFPLTIETSTLSRDALCSFPRVGTILRVIAKTYSKDIPQLQGGRVWVKLCNLVCETHCGIWQGVLQITSKIRFLSDDDDNVLIRERFYKERTSLERGQEVLRRPLTSFPWPSHITETDYDDEIDTTLIASLTHTEVTHKLKCVVRVIAANPWKFQDLWSPEKGYYMVRLILEDPTARIHAFLCGEDAVKFFGGCPPLDDLEIKWNMLLGISEDKNCAFRNPPWVFCCLKSYYINKNDPWGSRVYRIFSTKLVK